MISQDSIKNLSTKLQTTELNVRREYIQHVFLSYFYQQPETAKIYFKGGTALRILYNSPRFSEDLDFSASKTNIKDIESAVVNTLHKIERENIQTEIVESKKTSGGYLAILYFMLNDTRVSIQLEISLREGNKTGESTTIVNDFIPPYILTALQKDELVHEKIQALLTRQKPRDFYDLYFILRKPDMLPPQTKHVLSQVRQLIQGTSISFENELKVFLPKNQWPIIRDFKSILERELSK